MHASIKLLSRENKSNSFIKRTAQLSKVEKMKKIARNVNKMFCDQRISLQSSTDGARCDSIERQATRSASFVKDKTRDGSGSQVRVKVIKPRVTSFLDPDQSKTNNNVRQMILHTNGEIPKSRNSGNRRTLKVVKSMPIKSNFDKMPENLKIKQPLQDQHASL